MSRSERTAGEASPLAHPLWWTALGLLVLNDHVLKGAGVLPGVVTGKVSDLAGMIVAPVLLVAIVRARTTLARGACFATVGSVFGAIKLSGLAATWFAAALSLVGVRWRIWVDATDLVALLALPVAWTMTTPTKRTPRTALPVARVVHVLGGALGTLACLASSGGGPGTWSTPAYIVNETFQPLDIRIRYYDGDFGCLDLDEFAPRAFAPSSFGEGITFHLAPHETLPIDVVSVNAAANLLPPGESASQPPCDVVLLQADGMPDTLVWWVDQPVLGVPVRSTDPAFDNDPSLRQGRVDIGIGGFRVLTARARGSVRTAAASQAAPKSSCPQAPAYQWSIDDSTFIGYELAIASQTTLPDGCVDVELTQTSAPPGGGGAGGEGTGGDASGGAGGAGVGGGGGSGGAGEEPSTSTRLVMCLPSGVWPFEAGDLVVTELVGDAASSGLRVRGDAGAVAVYSGQVSAPLATGATGFSRVECEGDRTACGAFVVPVAVTSSGGTIEPGGSAKTTAADGTAQQLYLGRAEDVLATRDGCEPGRTGLGVRADMVVVSSEGGSR